MAKITYLLGSYPAVIETKDAKNWAMDKSVLAMATISFKIVHGRKKDSVGASNSHKLLSTVSKDT